MDTTVEPPVESAACRRVLRWVPDQISRCLGSLGGFAVARPRVLIGAALVLVMIGVPGWLRFRMSTDPQELWTPQNSPETRRQKYVYDTFGDKDLFFQVYIEAIGKTADSRHGALTIDAVRDVFRFQSGLKNMKVKGSGALSDVCKTLFTGFCMESGITRFWLWDSENFERSVNGSQEQLLLRVSSSSYSDGGQVILNDPFIDTTKSLDGTLISAKRLVLSFALDPDIPRDNVTRWFSAADEFTSSFMPQTEGLSFSSFHLKTLQNEVMSSAREDTPLVAAAVTLLIIICCAMMFRKNPVESRMSLALVGILCVILATTFGFGLCMAFGLPFTPMQQLLPFILLGIGVDDMFILIRGLDEAKVNLPGRSLEEHFRRALETSGVSITLTSFTNLLAFMLGSLSQLPAVRYFCIYAGIAIISDYILQLTLFLGAMVLTERRMQGGRMDLLPWKQAANPKEAGQSIAEEHAKKKPGFVSWLIDGYIAPFILHPWVQGLLILGFVGLAFAGVWGGLHVQIGQKFSSLVRRGSKAEEFLNQFEAAGRTQSAGPVEIYFSQVNFSQPQTQQRVLQSWEFAKQNSQFLSGPDSPQHCWLTKLLEFAKLDRENETKVLTDDGYIKPNQFDVILGEMLKHPLYKVWGEDVVFDATNRVTASRCPLLHGPVANTGSRLDILKGVNEVIDHTNEEIFGQERVVLLYNLHHVFYASDAILMHELFVNVSLALVGIVMVNMIMLLSPLGVLVMVTAVLLVELGLLAIMWCAGISLSSLTLLLIIMALGLGIDYPVHVLHRLLTIKCTSAKDQAHEALVSVGPAVSIGFVTTVSGILLLAGSRSMLFHTVFIMLVSTVCLAYAVGILYVPAVMVVTRLSSVTDLPDTTSGSVSKDDPAEV